MEAINTTEEFIPCPDCNGEGHVEILNCKSGSVAMCCVSCFENRVCETCHGSKEVENPNFEEQDDQRIISSN